ncbi:MAG: cell division protein SepF [Acidimicrobiales bacterium]|jgi:FtsZ-interacting cell division protein YlmF
MNEKMRHVLGFLGLVEDDYGDNSASAAARAFADQPSYDGEPEYSQPPVTSSSRPFPTVASGTGTTRTSAPPLRISSISVLDSSGQAPRVRPMASAGARGIATASQDRDVAVFFPSTYHESRRITDMLRNNRAVLLNVTEIDPGLARRLVDFAAGTAYAMNAKIEPLSNGVYLVSPQGTHISPDTKDRLRASNYRSLDNS